MRTLLTSIACLLFSHIFAQQLPKPVSQWKENFGGKRYDEAYDIIENMDGDLVLVGQCKNLDDKKDKSQKDIHKLDQNGNSDLLFLIITPQGKRKRIKSIGRANSERGNAVVQTLDGGYAIAGFTNSKTVGDIKAHGQKDAWLLKLDENGAYLWELRLGSAEHDWFMDVREDEDGNLLLTGTKKGDLYLAKVDQYGKLLWEQTHAHPKSKTRGNALVQLENKNLAVVGLSAKGRDEAAFFLKTSPNGTAIGNMIIYKSEYEEATDIIQTKDNNLVILSKTFTNKKTDHVGVRLVDSNGKLLTKKQFTYGDRQKDFPFAITQAFNDDLLITGGSKSHKGGGGTRHKVFLSRIDMKGNARHEKWATFYGGDYTDKANQIVQSADGSIYMAGNTFSEKITGHNSDVYVVKIKSTGYPSSIPANQLSHDNKLFVESSGDDALETDERAYYKFQITNAGKTDAFNIKANIQQTTQIPHVVYPKNITLGYLPAGKSKTFSIPIKGEKGLIAGIAKFIVRFTEANSAAIPSIEFNIKTINEPAPILAVTNHVFSKETNLQREAPIKLKVTLKNTGNKVATNIRSKFSFDKNVFNISDKYLSIPVLAPNESHTFEVDFKIGKVYMGDHTKVGFRFAASEQPYEAGVLDYYPLQTDLEFLELPKLLITSSETTPPIDQIKKGAEAEWEITLRNDGEVEAFDLSGNFFHESNVIELNSKGKDLVVINGGETKTFKYKFKIKENTTDAFASLGFRFDASEKTSPSFPEGRVARIEIPIAAPAKAPALSVSNYEFEKKKKLGMRGEQITLKIQLNNNGGIAKGFTASFAPTEGIKSLSKKELEVSPIAENETEELSFQFQVEDNFPSEQVFIPFVLKDQSGTHIKKDFALALEPLLPANALPLSQPILTVNQLSSKGQIEKGKPITVFVQLKNTGEVEASGIRGKFGFEKNIEALSEKTFRIEKLEPGKSELLSLEFKTNSAFLGNSTDISFSYQTNEKDYIDIRKEAFKISFNQVASNDYVDIDWSSPAPPPKSPFIIKGLGETSHLLKVELEVFSNKKINKENFEIQLNGVVQNNSKAGEEPLRNLRPGKRKRYLYANKVSIPEGDHEVNIIYKDGEKVYKSKTLNVQYKPNTLNLHLLAIGIDEYSDGENINDLSYPSRDVQDIARIFKAQEGKLFENVYTTLICDDCEDKNTTKQSIQLSLNGFAQDQDQSLGKNDLAIIYISSHGKEINGRFKILPKDYVKDPRDVDGNISTVDFKKYVLNNLALLDDVHKFLFVDACHSGTAGVDIDKFNEGKSKDEKDLTSIVLKQLIESDKNINPMMSCMDNELSWEHADWKNGAFTEGMLEAFENKEVPIGNNKTTKASEDAALTFGELYEFLQKRVPYLVSQKCGTTQTPYVPEKVFEDETVRNLQFYITQ